MNNNFDKNNITEIDGAKKLYNFRKKNKLFFSPSFETISGFGYNGSIIHYNPSKRTNKLIKRNNIFLIDSGAQYIDGTTDITRTISIGKPRIEQMKMYTRVLKGNIALTNTMFDEKTTGKKLDRIARKYLLDIKKDYEHGTGHGVGSFLSVHEWPPSISKSSNTSFVNGMIVSNEPGYYKKKDYGIRIENLLLVIKKKNKLLFDVLTLAPIDLKLIIKDMLTIKEKEWLNNYHKKTYKKISNFLNNQEKDWLKKETRPI